MADEMQMVTLPDGTTVPVWSGAFGPGQIDPIQQASAARTAKATSDAAAAGMLPASAAAGTVSPLLGLPAAAAGIGSRVASAVRPMLPTGAATAGAADAAARGIRSGVAVAGSLSPTLSIPGAVAGQAMPAVEGEIRAAVGGPNAADATTGGGFGVRAPPPAGPPRMGTTTVDRPRLGAAGGLPMAPTDGPAPWLARELEARGEYTPPPRPLSPMATEQEREQGGFDDALRAQEALTRERAAAAELEAEELRRQREERVKAVEAAKAVQAEAERATGELITASDAARRKAAAKEVDAERYWNSRGNLARALGSIGIMFGNVGEIWGAPRNLAKEIIDDAIARDIQEQEIEMQQAWRSADAADNALARYADLYGSIPAARAQVHAAMLDQQIAEMKSALLARGVAEEKAQSDANITTMTAERDMQIAQRNQAILMAKEQMAQQNAAAQAAARSKPAKPPDIERVINWRGQPLGVAKNKESARAIQERLNAGAELSATLDELERMNAASGAVNLSPTQRQAFEARLVDGLTQYKDFRQMGTMDAQTERMARAAFPSSNNLGDWNQARIDALRSQIESSVSIIRQNSTVDPMTGRGVEQPGEELPEGAVPVR